ncbi:MAG: hypothetical protein DMF60_07915 [Acidobacteria bacterium]|nr:MAG: hypothetical protein DMF60_07915 [Acidobacteriota bacterium]
MFMQDFIEDVYTTKKVTSNIFTRILQLNERSQIFAGRVWTRGCRCAYPPTVADATFGNAPNRPQRVQTCECHSLPVAEDRRVVGILTMETLGEFAMRMLR